MKTTYKLLPEHKDKGVIYCLRGKDNIFEVNSYSTNFKEYYLLIFTTKEDAEEYKKVMDNKHSWFKNRETEIVPINSNLKKFRAKYYGNRIR